MDGIRTKGMKMMVIDFLMSIAVGILFIMAFITVAGFILTMVIVVRELRRRDKKDEIPD